LKSNEIDSSPRKLTSLSLGKEGVAFLSVMKIVVGCEESMGFSL